MSSSSMSPSNGVVLATAMAVSGTVILLAMRLQKSLTTTTPAATTTTTPTTTTTTQFLISPVQQLPAPRSCISPECGNIWGKREKKKKKVHFAQDVVDTRGSSEEFRRRMRSSDETSLHSSLKNGRKIRDMPANRMALYNGMLKDRVLHRVAYSY
ncbi:hypothetical protein RJ639_019955 [Escallonia herrerae]|uniref:Uncharacterized protein n=1 Tax=Escallonia herrerae TaxID=1293975 RepID=A0AA89AIJ8_9ASTE|nr:hypothetical protein RJ639_019955 [Escallonia herrerae]